VAQAQPGVAELQQAVSRPVEALTGAVVPAALLRAIQAGQQGQLGDGFRPDAEQRVLCRKVRVVECDVAIELAADAPLHAGAFGGMNRERLPNMVAIQHVNQGE
jgi:hypothetical protein